MTALPSDEKSLVDSVLALGPAAASLAKVKDFVFDPKFRAFCEANHCGHYDRNWKCPPRLGEIGALVEEAREYGKAVVYQVVGELRHSLDWKGTLASGKVFNRITRGIADGILPRLEKAMLLGSGPCQICEICALVSSEPCRNPGKAVRSLEANCVDVSALAATCGLRYVNGPNTVTLFGALLFG